MISGFPSDTLTTLMLSGSRNVTHFSRLRTQTWSEASAACAGAAQASSQAAARPIFKLFFMDSPWGSGRILAGNQRRVQLQPALHHLGPRLVEQVVGPSMHAGRDRARLALAAAEIEEARHVAEDEVEAVVVVGARGKIGEEACRRLVAEQELGDERASRERRRALVGG